MVKQELEEGQLVVLRNRQFGLVLPKSKNELEIVLGNEGETLNDNASLTLDAYDSFMQIKDEYEDEEEFWGARDIIAVYDKSKLGSSKNFIFEIGDRKLLSGIDIKSYLSHVEIMVLMNLDSKWKYLVRDLYGDLYVSTWEPYKMGADWGSGDNKEEEVVGLIPFNHLFSCVHVTDDKPLNIRKLLKKYNV